MDSKKVIEKLIRIAENQQKIITKLAQQAGVAPQQPIGWQDVTHSVAQILATLPGGKAARVASAQVGSENAEVRLNVRDLTSNVDQQLRSALAGKTVQNSSGQTVKFPQDPSQINVVSQMG